MILASFSKTCDRDPLWNTQIAIVNGVLLNQCWEVCCCALALARQAPGELEDLKTLEMFKHSLMSRGACNVIVHRG
jgi:hypothetical protein